MHHEPPPDAPPRVIVGDCLAIMPTLEAESIDAIVSDPPYGLGFMGKQWDHGVPGADFWREALRVAKPGAHLVAFGGTRTYHRLACAIEDAGWEIRDCLMWLYGSGFPKHRSKLKPAWEPVVLARRPAPKATPLNIDACRIECAPGDIGDRIDPPGRASARPRSYTNDDGSFEKPRSYTEPAGRWPANVVLDEDAAAMLDAETGERPSGASARGQYGGMGYHGAGPWEMPAIEANTGGASRFFYCAKASRGEREAGLEHLEKRAGGSNAGGYTDDVARGLDRNRPVANNHPTVKPLSLMRWLVRLVTPPGGLVLDPFNGSGSTGCAAVLEGMRYIGCELSEDYATIARARIAHWHGVALAEREAAERAARERTPDLFDAAA